MSKNNRLLLILAGLALGMLFLAYAFVPLYKMFCDALGIPVPSILVGEAGAPKPAIYDESKKSDRVITVRFMANTAVGVPVSFSAKDRRLQARVGEPVLTAYYAKNYSPRPLDGLAVHTMVPAGGSRSVNMDDYIELQQCFCFEEQHYPAGEDLILPLSFTISPDLPEQIHTITFGYTLFESQ